MRPLADRLSRPRLLHPVAWWTWGLLLAAAATRTTNPWVLGSICLVIACVVLQRKEIGTTNAIAVFVTIALVAVVLRVLLMVVLGSSVGGSTTVVDLPQVPLPDWMAGVRLGGPVQLAALLDALYKGLQLATVLLCVGACNALADPRRLLRYVPATLYDAGTAIVVSLTYMPQLADDAASVRRARRLRGHRGRGLREVARLVVPVLENSLERSIHLAASMEARGYGRITLGRAARRRATALTIIGLAGVLVGLVALLGGSLPTALGPALLVAGVLIAGAALLTGARQDQRTPYRRDRWRLPENVTVLSAVAPLVVTVWGERSGWPGIVVAQTPVTLPPLLPPLLTAVLLAALPAVLAPRTPRRAAREDERRTPQEPLEPAAPARPSIRRERAEVTR